MLSEELCITKQQPGLTAERQLKAVLCCAMTTNFQVGHPMMRAIRLYFCKTLKINYLTLIITYMNKFIIKVLPVAGLLVDALIIVDIASDLVKKHRDRKSNEPVAVSADSSSTNLDE